MAADAVDAVLHAGRFPLTHLLCLTCATFLPEYGFLGCWQVLTCQELPHSEEDFFELLKIYFPVLYDIKYLMKSCKTLKGGLQEVADDLGVCRVGPQHQVCPSPSVCGRVSL